VARAFIGMGSNVEPERNLREALRLLASAVLVLDLSTVYLTPPVGRPEQASYYNCIAAIETALEPLELKQRVLRTIEDRLGRVRNRDTFAPRPIDLDLLVYDDLVLREEGLELPDPDIFRRSFLAAGLHELAPGLILPGTNTAIAAFAAGLNRDGMKRLDSYTSLLKGELHHGL
jgi:dihydroneopterin aldolase/2-amino-4-hydroxy-6-hydroxymethyldihydropteridine diphosphokinase